MAYKEVNTLVLILTLYSPVLCVNPQKNNSDIKMLVNVFHKPLFHTVCSNLFRKNCVHKWYCTVTPMAIFVQPIAAQCWRSRGRKILKILGTPYIYFHSMMKRNDNATDHCLSCIGGVCNLRFRDDLYSLSFVSVN